jgi:hypothetical protein
MTSTKGKLSAFRRPLLALGWTKALDATIAPKTQSLAGRQAVDGKFGVRGSADHGAKLGRSFMWNANFCRETGQCAPRVRHQERRRT